MAENVFWSLIMECVTATECFIYFEGVKQAKWITKGLPDE